MTLTEKVELLDLLLIKYRVAMPEKMKKLYEKVRYKFFYGGRGGAKSISTCKYVLDRASKEKIRILATREIQISIKESIHSTLKDLIQELKYDDFIVNDHSIKNNKTGSEFIFTGLYMQEKKQSIQSLANIDICIVEEAQSVSDGSLRILDPTIRKENSEIIFLFNRNTNEDPVWKFMLKMPENNKIVQEINYYDNDFLPEVLLKQALHSKELHEKKIDNDYLHTWLGYPRDISNKTLFKISEIESAINKEINDEGQIEIGADIARYGNDLTVFFKRKGFKIIDYRVFSKISINEIVKELKDFVNYDKIVYIKIDDTGVGGGVTDYMIEDGYNVIPVNNGSNAIDSDRYTNRISEMWFHLKNIINEISIPDIQELKFQLQNREWALDTKGRRKIESKDDYIKKWKKSPDFADALLLCFAEIDTINIRFL